MGHLKNKSCIKKIEAARIMNKKPGDHPLPKKEKKDLMSCCLKVKTKQFSYAKPTFLGSPRGRGVLNELQQSFVYTTDYFL